jgi:hypothetical protein
LYAHVRSLVRSRMHSSVHSFALRSSPRPLATRTPYVHRVSWSYKSIVYEALKKANLYISNSKKIQKMVSSTVVPARILHFPSRNRDMSLQDLHEMHCEDRASTLQRKLNEIECIRTNHSDK